MKGQGLGEDALILVLFAVALIVFLVVFGPFVRSWVNSANDHSKDPCAWSDTQILCQHQKVQQCLALELGYTKDQCVILVGGVK